MPVVKYQQEHAKSIGHDLLLGGEATMWTDEYCPHSKCVGHAATWGGKVGWLFEKKKTSSLPKTFLQ